MELQLVTFEQAQKLKKFGFPQGGCWKGYMEDCEGNGILMDKDSYTCSAPEMELAAKWLRDEKNVHIYMTNFSTDINWWESNLVTTSDGSYINSSNKCTSYDDALSKGIDAAFEYLNQIKKEQFLRFRKLQYSGVINMNDVTNGCKLSSLPQDVYEDIMRNYEEYLELYT